MKQFGFLTPGGWVIAVVALAAACPSARAADAETELFEKKIRPLLVENCYKCHSTQSEKLKGGLLLDSRDGLLKGGETGPAVVPGDPSKSLLIKAVRYSDADLQMPPDHKLTDAQVADLEAWVTAGAPDPRVAAPAAAAPAAEKPAELNLEEARKWWAFQPPRDHPLPPVNDAAWARQPLDAFVLARLEQKGLKPAPPADRRALIRRAYHDLTGLPPAPADVEAFVNDNAPDAFAKVVDRLLASPLYGQRWARHWLDVVRYTDSFDARGVGGQFDVPEAYRYRDWVVDAFNRDLPYDQFITHQVAGDLLPPAKPGTINADGLVATGVYVIGEWGTGDADKEKMLTDIVDDQIDVTGRAFMGLTLACARCHDHKFDPISAADYYSLAGIFFSSHILPNPGIKTAGSPVLRIPLTPTDDTKDRERDTARLAAVDKEVEQLLDEVLAARAKELFGQADQYLLAAWDYEHRPADQAAVALDAFAADRKLDAYALRQWVHFAGSGPLALLAQPVDGVGGQLALKGFRPPDGADNPSVTVNPSDAGIAWATIRMPPKSFAVHPSPQAGVTVGWRSPITGLVRVRGRVADADGVAGDGIAWGLGVRSPGGGTTELLTGRIENGANQDLATTAAAIDRLNNVPVEQGQIVQLTVLPKGDYNCDMTVVELEITETGGQQRVWSLAKDVVPAPLKGGGNPHADQSGQPGVWLFYDAGEGAAAAGFGPDSVMNTWYRAVASASGAADPAVARAETESAASSVKAVLSALGPVIEQLRASGKKGGSVEGSNAKLYDMLTAPRGPFWAAARADLAALPAGPQADRVKSLRDEQTTLRERLAKPPAFAHGLQEGGTPQSMFPGTQDVPIHLRGRYDKLGPVVPRGFPRVVAGENQPPITKGSGRLELAQWLTRPDHPLTARVMVNRIWMHHFGEGLVRTPNNFGKLGQPPTHPELLDHLALEFVRSGWSIKTMHRRMMLSATYAQSSSASAEVAKADPENLLLGRMNRRKLDAEGLRDSLLSVAGMLDTTAGGPAVPDLNTTRRTLYIQTIRSDRSNYRMLFDAADPGTIVEKRTDSTVAPQALYLMNHPFVLDQSGRLAGRALRDGGADDAARIDWLYRTLYARPPEAAELEIGRQLLSRARNLKGADGRPIAEDAAWQEYCHVLVCANEFMYVD